MNIAENLVATAAAHPDLVAVRMDDVSLTYAELGDLVARTAGWIRERGVEPGDRVAVSLPNIPQMPVVYYAALHAGGIVVPTNPLFRAREFGHMLRDSGARVLFGWSGISGEAAKAAEEEGVTCVEVGESFLTDAATHDGIDLVDRDGDDTAVILYTSGTTEPPRAPSSPTRTWAVTPRSAPRPRSSGSSRATSSSAVCRCSTCSDRPA